MADGTEVTDGPSATRRRWARRLVTVVVAAIGAAAVTGLVVTAAFWWIYDTASIPSAENLHIPDPTRIVDRDGATVDTFAVGAVRRNVSLDDLPDHVPAAVLAAEDRRFHDHRGFSPRAIVRASLANVRARSVEQGASTITQQYVGMGVSRIGDGYLAKFREVATAARLEDELTKEEILELYLNAVPFGRTAHGIEAAARTYFGVAAAELDVEQAATLAGMIAAPTAFDPARNPEGASQRRDRTIAGMVAMGAIEPAAAEDIVGSPLPELRTDPLVTFGPDAYFVDAVRSAVPHLIDDGRDASVGLVVHTTLDRSGQRDALQAVRDGLADTPYSGALVTVENGTGAVRALVGGLDFAEQQFNVATRGRRQVGSAFKAFTLAELVAQGYGPDQVRVDAPRELQVDSDGSTATVRNASGRGHGEVTAREATVSSINTAYLQLAEEVGVEAIADRARELGIDAELPVVPSLTLGTAEITPIDLAGAYATIAADGTRREPYLIERIETVDGQVLFAHAPDPVEALDVAAARVVTDVLTDVVRHGTGRAAAIDRPVAGKTGTTDAHVDAWFVGYTVRHTTAVWVGNLDSSPMEAITGGSLPAAIWAAHMGRFSQRWEPEEFPAGDTSTLSGLDGSGDRDEDGRGRDPGQAEPPGREPGPAPEPEPAPGPEPAPEPEPAPPPEPAPDPGDDGGLVEDLLDDEVPTT